MSVAAKKTLEAEEHIRKAEKYLKTSFMKWTPDYDPAADEFSRAATCFKVSKEYVQALDALNRACECYKEVKSLYQAAKMLEQAVLICRDSGKLDMIEDYASRGGLLYRQHGSPESAAQLLEKAAKILEPKDPEHALRLYARAAETIATEDRPKEASEYLTKVSRLNAKAKRYEETINTLRCSKFLIIDFVVGRDIVYAYSKKIPDFLLIATSLSTSQTNHRAATGLRKNFYYRKIGWRPCANPTSSGRCCGSKQSLLRIRGMVRGRFVRGIETYTASI